jgi:cyclophilin family peptidyl-prolyl cis-trans isomerase
VEAAAELGLNIESFEEDLREGRYAENMEAAFQEALASGLAGTPTMFINGELLRLGPDLVALEAAVRLKRLEARQYGAYPPMDIDPQGEYRATLRLSTGDVRIRLLPKIAPKAVNSFVFLARESWFDGMPIHRVIPGVLVETGDPTGTGFGGPGYHFGLETDADFTFDAPGMVAMSSSGPGTNGSIFFISLEPMPELNGSRTIFGRVISGLDLLSGLAAREPSRDLLSDPEAFVQGISIEGP